jgi:hypothetical protein
MVNNKSLHTWEERGIPGQPGLYSETLSQKTKTKLKQKKRKENKT